METLVAGPHRNHQQYHGRNRGHGSTRFGSFGPPSGSFRGINCRTFQSGEGLISNPFKSSSNTTPVSKKAFCSFSPKTPSPSPSPSLNGTQNPKTTKRIAKSSSSPIPFAINIENKEGEFHFSELWAGPAYSNSPPPSSLPIPKFSLRPKRTVSLELPSVSSEFDLLPISKSAPASPTRERSSSPSDLFGIADSVTKTLPSPSDLFDITDSATKTLRRILNLDITDE